MILFYFHRTSLFPPGKTARAAGGFLLALTHELVPGDDMDDAALRRLLTSPNTRAGFVAIQGTAAAKAATEPAGEKTGTAYVLHYTPRQLTVGPLADRAEASLTDGKAKKWATDLIGAERGHLLEWSRIDAKRPDDG